MGERVKELSEKGQLPLIDFIFVTGDLAFSGGIKSHDEYSRARNYLVEISLAAKISKEQIFLVPGNHDVQHDFDQSRDIRRLVTALRNGDEDLDEALADSVNYDGKTKPDREKLICRFSNYLKLADEFGPGRHPERTKASDQRLWWAFQLRPHQTKVRLIGINTALLSAEGDDRGKLRLGKTMLGETLTSPELRKDELVILLSHHPLSGGWLADEREVNEWVGGHAHVHLCGHTHESNSVEVRSGSGEHIVRIAAGSAYDGQNAGAPTAHSYWISAIFKRENGDYLLRIWSRKWSAKRANFAWDVNNAPDGKFYADHILRSIGTPDVNDDLRAVVSQVDASQHGGSDKPSMLKRAKWFGLGILFDRLVQLFWGSKFLATTGVVIVVASGAVGTAVTVNPELPARAKQRLHDFDVRSVAKRVIERLQTRPRETSPTLDFGLIDSPPDGAATPPDFAARIDFGVVEDLASADIQDLSIQNLDAAVQSNPDMYSSSPTRKKKKKGATELTLSTPVAVEKKPGPVNPTNPLGVVTKPPDSPRAKNDTPQDEDEPKDIWELACRVFMLHKPKYEDASDIVNHEYLNLFAERYKLSDDDPNLFYKIIEKTSGLKFAKGHDRAGDFMRLNPKLIDWLDDNIVKNPPRRSCFQKVYSNSFRPIARIHTAVFIVLEEKGYFKKFAGAAFGYDSDYHKFCEDVSKLDQGRFGLKGLDDKAISRACGFWLRRRTDGTYTRLANLLKSIMQEYDRNYYDQHASKLP